MAKHGGPSPASGPVVKAKDAKGTIRKLLQYLVEEKLILSLVFFLTLLYALLSLSGPYLIGVAIDRYILPGDFKGLLRVVFLLMAVHGLGPLAQWYQSYLMIGVAQGIVFRMRSKLFSVLQSLPLRFFDTKTHGELMSRLTNDVENVSSSLAGSVTSVFHSSIMVVGTLIMMVILSPVLTVFSIFIIPLMAITTKIIAKKTKAHFKKQQEYLGEINGLIEETISGQRVVKVFCREETILADFEGKNQSLRKSGTNAQIFSGFIPPLMNMLNNLSFVIVAAVGGYLAVEGRISVGVIAAFLNYSKQFTRPLNELANQFNAIQSGIAGAERVFEIMQEEPETPDKEDAQTLEEVSGHVTLEDVFFSYREDTPVLKGVSLDVKQGETIALVGPTGAGKTTIINLLTRFYDIHQGKLTIDGRDILDLKRDNLRSFLGIVLQDTYLFSASVRENIRYGRLGASDEDVEEAARLANAHSFIMRLPEGYDTVLSEDGGNLSQGQRQLLSIARAILANPAILILDEATSSVDTRTEVQIQQAMLNLMKGRTSFVIAHRLSTIRDADRIVVICDGQIVEEGNHVELLERRTAYYELYQSQYKRVAS